MQVLVIAGGKLQNYSDQEIEQNTRFCYIENSDGSFCLVLGGGFSYPEHTIFESDELIACLRHLRREEFDILVEGCCGADGMIERWRPVEISYIRSLDNEPSKSDQLRMRVQLVLELLAGVKQGPIPIKRQDVG